MMIKAVYNIMDEQDKKSNIMLKWTVKNVLKTKRNMYIKHDYRIIKVRTDKRSFPYLKQQELMLMFIYEAMVEDTVYVTAY